MDKRKNKGKAHKKRQKLGYLKNGCFNFEKGCKEKIRKSFAAAPSEAHHGKNDKLNATNTTDETRQKKRWSMDSVT